MNQIYPTRSQKEYLETKKEYFKLKNKEYHETHKEQIKARNSLVCICSCGMTYTHNHKLRHEKSKKH